MTPELQKYYDERFSMMATQGWEDLLEDAQKMVEAYDKIDRLNSIEDLHYAKGQLDILRWLLNLKETSTEAFEELNNAQDV